MNAVSIQAEKEGSEAKPVSAKTVSPKSTSSEDDECGTCGEGMAAKLQKLKELPSSEEVEVHNLSHVPYRSWCPHCVKGKGVASKHVKQDSSRNEVPTISMDYFYFIKGESKDERGPPSIVIIDDKTGMVKSAVLKQKGVE